MMEHGKLVKRSFQDVSTAMLMDQDVLGVKQDIRMHQMGTHVSLVKNGGQMSVKHVMLKEDVGIVKKDIGFLLVHALNLIGD